MTYLMPKGWTGKDNVSWNLARRTAPVEFTFTAASPDQQSSFMYANELAFSYTRTPNVGNSGTQPPAVLSQFMISLFKKNHPGVDAEVLEQTDTRVPSIFPSTGVMTSRAEKCSVKVRYTLNGVRMTMKAMMNFDGYESGTAWGRAHGFTNGDWYLNNMAQVVGPEKDFDKVMKFAAVAYSLTLFDPVFVQKCQQVSGQIVSDMIGAGWARIDANGRAQQQALKDKWAANDKFTRDMCDYVLDRERYTDGTTEFIMPNGYNRAITDGSGDYIMTNNHNLSPGPGWSDLKKVN